MLKAVGILCILAGSTGLGMSMARELELRIEELLQLQKLMLRLRGRSGICTGLSRRLFLIWPAAHRLLFPIFSVRHLWNFRIEADRLRKRSGRGIFRNIFRACILPDRN